MKKFSFPKMQNRQLIFSSKIQYELAAERSEAASSCLPFYKVCAHEESNLDYGIRNPVSYPLNDERVH